MNVRQAILAAASHIERNPDQYKFHANGKPACGTPGCLMGWIGVYAGVAKSSHSYMNDTKAALGFDYQDITQFWSNKINSVPHNDWMRLSMFQVRADAAAELLRVFADERFPAEPLKFPDWNAMAAVQTVAADAVDEMVRQS